jgi:VanZ family protein
LYFVLVAVLLVIALLPQPLAPEGTPSDKVNHIFAFFTLAFLARLLWRKKSVWVPVASLTLFGALIEILQATMGLGRDGEWADFLADVVAIFAGLTAARLAFALWNARIRRG